MINSIKLDYLSKAYIQLAKEMEVDTIMLHGEAFAKEIVDFRIFDDKLINKYFPKMLADDGEKSGSGVIYKGFYYIPLKDITSQYWQDILVPACQQQGLTIPGDCDCTKDLIDTKIGLSIFATFGENGYSSAGYTPITSLNMSEPAETEILVLRDNESKSDMYDAIVKGYEAAKEISERVNAKVNVKLLDIPIEEKPICITNTNIDHEFEIE